HTRWPRDWSSDVCSSDLPLVENLPAQVRITANGFKASADLPDTLQLNQLELTGKGDLKNGYQLLGKATLPAEQGPVDLLLQGKEIGRASCRERVWGGGRR